MFSLAIKHNLFWIYKNNQQNFCEWLFKVTIYQKLLSASANALKISQKFADPMESFIDVHRNCKRSLPFQIMEYKHSILLHKVINNQIPSMDWVELNFYQTNTSRQTFFNLTRMNKSKIGNNLLSIMSYQLWIIK